MTQIDIVETTRMEDGSCNGCQNRTGNYLVYKIQFKTIAVCVCDSCRKELMEKLAMTEKGSDNAKAQSCQVTG